MAYNWVDLSTIFDPQPDEAPPAEWGDQISDNLNHLYERIERVVARTVLGGAASSISSGTLPAVSNGWRLRVVVEARHATTTSQNVLLRLNGDSGTNYWRQYLYGSDTSVVADAPASVAETSIAFGSMGNEHSSSWSVSEAVIDAYLASRYKTVRTNGFDPRNVTAPLLLFGGAQWRSTAAVTSVSVHAGSGNFAGGSALTVLATPLPV